MAYFPTRILLATDGSPDAALALRAAVDLSTRTASELHVVHAWQALPSYPHPSIAMATDPGPYEQEAQRVLFEQLDDIDAAGGEAAGAHLKRGRPYEVIADLAAELRVGLVVVGSRGLGPVKRLVLGTVSEGVIDLAPAPVLVVRGGDWTWPPSRVVVVGEESSLGARKAGEVAAGIGKIFGTQVLLVRTRPALAPMSEVVRHAQAATASPDDALRRYELDLEWRASRLERELGQRPRIRVMEGEAASVILKAAEESGKPALIAVGRRGLGMVDRLRLGSVSTKVLRAAAGPVLVCPS